MHQYQGPLCSAFDRDVLEILYEATDGPNWRRNTNWLTDAPLDEWHGVATDSAGRVSRLRLDDNQLTGEIPAQLGQLANLQRLSLGWNQLTGEIPPALGQLANLQYLWLRRNQLTGEIPLELGQLVNLQGLSLGENQLTGEIPPELGQLGNLQQYLYLDANQLTGEIPPELGQLANLQYLHLDANQLTGEIPPELGQLANLQYLHLGANQLTGEIPPALGQLANLLVVGLYDNQLTGEIPPALGQLANLQNLNLNANQLAGEIPHELGQLAELEDLSLHGNQLTGEVSTSYLELAELSVFRFANNNGLCAPDTDEFRTWLEGILYSGPLCTESDRDVLEILYEATDGPNWRRNTNWLTDAPLDEWYGVATDSAGRVTNIALAGNGLAGEIPPELGQLANLAYLYLAANQLTGEIPPELGQLANLRHLNLRANQLAGEIPPELGQLSNLQRLHLHENQLTGEVPTSYLGLAALSVFRFANNNGLCAPDTEFRTWLEGMDQYPGPLCTAFDRDVLEILYEATDGPNWRRNTNWLTDAPLDEWYGVATDSAGRVSSMSLHANQLTGEIPPELGQLANLQHLLLNENQLTGEVPTSYLELAELSTFHFDNNNGLCAPDTDEFRTWLEGIQYQSGSFYPSDRDILEILYEATDGPNWSDNTNWLTDVLLYEWHGVATDDNGRVTHLDLYNNDLFGTIPAELGNLSNLQGLELSHNDLSGTIPAELGNLSNLQELILDFNDLSGTIPAELGNLSNLQRLELSHNDLSGTIPAELGNLSNLLYLHLFGNGLTGALPSNLTSISGLSWFSWEQVSGTEGALCAPTDSTFQTWLSGIGDTSGPNCSDSGGS